MLEPETSTLYSMDQEVILMVGIQGSGKSFIAERYLKRANYEVVSNDKSGGRDKVLRFYFLNQLFKIRTSLNLKID
jgi:hypothetical protein